MTPLERKKAALVARIARQRRDLAYDAQGLQPTLCAVDKGIAVGRYLSAHPLIPAVAAAAFALLKPARTFQLLKRGWFLWGVFKNAREKLLA